MEDKLVGKKIQAVAKEIPNIGIDLDDTFQEDVLEAVDLSQLDSNVIESFSTVAQTREEIYKAIDIMAQDSKVSAILETYTDYVTETNDNGKIVWCESNDEAVGKYVNFLLNSLDVDKHAYSWVYKFITDGDIYWRMFRESDFKDDVLFNDEADKDAKEKRQKLNEAKTSVEKQQEAKVVEDIKKLDESIILNINDTNDHYVHYIEPVPNPGEMFELTKHGKSMAYIKANVDVQKDYNTGTSGDALNFWIAYKMKRKDVEVYDPTTFVHAYLKSSSSRSPEEVNIYLNDEDYDNNKVSSSYNVRRGQSLLYNKFRSWRELTLLENSILLNRVTKSAIVRVVGIPVGNMPKDQIVNYIQRIKEKIEQKSAVMQDKSFTEYNNPGPIENVIYVPFNETQGNLQFTTMGGDVDVKSLADIEYFENDFYGGFGIPKQYFGRTNDSTGFNGGTALSIISSKFGKNVKSIQNDFLQGLTDVINLLLLDKGLLSYVNNFTLKMQEPVTVEFTAKQEAQQTRVAVIQDLMQQLDGNIEDKVIKLKLLKELYSTTGVSPEILQLIQDQIDIYELEKKNEENPDDNNDNNDNESTPSAPSGHRNRPSFSDADLPGVDLEPEEEMGGEEIEEPIENTEGEILPSPADLGIDMTSSETV